MKKFFLRYHIFHKRLFCRPVFLILLMLIPLAGMLIGTLSGMDSGIITVYLATEGESEIANKAIDSLMADEGIIRFVLSDKEEAIGAVRKGEADAAWVFAEDADSKMPLFVKNGTSRHAFVKIYQREDSTELMLAREKLCGEVYPYLSRVLYLNYVGKEITSELSEKELLAYYDEVMPEGEELFDVNIGENASSGGAESYISAPVRGIMSVLLMLAGMALAMFYGIDEEKGLFFGIREVEKGAFYFGYILSGIIDIAVVMLISLYFSGVFTSLLRELIIMALFAISAALFSMLLRRLTVNLGVFCALLPLLIIGMLVLCPIFFNAAALRPLQMLFPPYYYLNAVYNDAYILRSVVYSAVLLTCLALIFGIGRFRGKSC